MTPVEASDRRRSFCARLKSERERRGTPVEAIAASTKIKGSLLDALERGDLSRWPKGIYRRAFFREYVAAIGLPAEPTVSDFLEIFSDGEAPRALPTAATAVSAGPADTNLRLFLADPMGAAPAATGSAPMGGPGNAPRGAPRSAPRSAAHDLQTRLAGAVADVTLVGLIAWACSAVLHLTLAHVALGLGAAGYLVSAWQHVSPSLLLFAWLAQLRRTQPAPQVQTFEPAALPYNFEAPAPARPSLRGRLADAIGGSYIREYVERLSETDLTFKSQRRRDLASVRRQRAEAANRTDELSVM